MERSSRNLAANFSGNGVVEKWPRSEVELGRVIVAWLRDQKWEVYQEVQNRSRVADIVAVRDKVVWVIELKAVLRLAIMEQADGWLGAANYVSCAVPRRRVSRFVKRALEASGIGLLLARRWGQRYEVHEYLRPHLARRYEAVWRLDERHKTFAEAGNALSLRLSPFKVTCENVLRAAKRTPGLTMTEVIRSIEHHYSSSASARCSLLKWIQTGEVPGVEARLQEGRYRIYAKTRIVSSRVRKGVPGLVSH